MLFWLVALISLAGLFAQTRIDPASLPARDSHEGLLIACDPYQDSARAESRMGKKNPFAAGILPIEVYFRNNSAKAVRVKLGTIRLVVASPGQERQQLEAMTVEEIADRMLNKKGAPDVGSPRRRLPRPIPQGSGRDKKSKELEAKLQPLMLVVGVVGPGATVHGFLFFDVQHRYDLVASSRLYVPDLNFMEGNQPLTYFEVDLAPAARR